MWPCLLPPSLDHAGPIRGVFDSITTPNQIYYALIPHPP